MAKLFMYYSFHTTQIYLNLQSLSLHFFFLFDLTKQANENTWTYTYTHAHKKKGSPFLRLKVSQNPDILISGSQYCYLEFSNFISWFIYTHYLPLSNNVRTSRVYNLLQSQLICQHINWIIHGCFLLNSRGILGK